MNDNFGNGMNDDSFNVFNQNAEAYKQQQELLRQQAAAAQQAALEQQQALAQQHEQNLQQQAIQNIQEVDKNPSIFSKFGKKKKKEEERKFDLNDPSTFTKVEKPKKELDEKEKGKMELVLLLVLLVVLGVVGYWAFTVFKNTMGISNVDNSESLIHEENKKIGNYSCEKDYSNNYLVLPYSDLISQQLSSYQVNYYSDENNKLTIKEESILVNYGNINMQIKNELQKFCNSYNNINDSYQLTCNLKNNIMLINNSFDLTKIDGKVTNGNIVYDIGVTKDALIKDVINTESEQGSNCTLIENEE